MKGTQRWELSSRCTVLLNINFLVLLSCRLVLSCPVSTWKNFGRTTSGGNIRNAAS